MRIGEDSAVHVQYLRGPLPARVGSAIRTGAPPVDAGSLRGQTAQSVKQALAAHDGNVSAAARQLGISRTTLYKHLRP